MASRYNRESAGVGGLSQTRPSSQKCAYHPTRYITGFCRRSECMLPVCPVCVPLHVEQHKLAQTTPDYEEYARVYTVFLY